MPRSPAANAELALLLEVAGTPKPGNVDRERDVADLRFEHFLAGAVGARPGLERAAAGAPVGEAFEDAVAGMAEHGRNTQFGCLLLLVPLVRAAARDDCTPEGVADVVADTTVADAAGFYRAFEHADVAVSDPPEEMAALDVRRGADAIPALESRGTTLADVLAAGAPDDGVATLRGDPDSLAELGDGNAAEWCGGFARSFDAAERIAAGEGPILERTADVFLALLGEGLDTLLAKQHGLEAAFEVRERARDLHESGASREAVSAFGDELVARGWNPGTTADAVAAGLFVALERGVSV
ncbi:2-(5''-triphosphoribosyl)-3'-dephosphocoenzyme-A synthase [Halarchaeum grantii]|uniref:2-(5''-triphosphoribosyl)-3'-dephosphocoenzyme-A synthase n=1 Tax=Halarchaeum grantii TaxID=1193105 RepID=A0A830F6S9_9EURY|nr:triphosphoribosyl-dephospho-CoA synthase [Halarchaeum grantii]GGL24810.1 2-(5''-triphosphoribosyl)-3'-dephosphocoenzyme-A synthase [Halarchaeum grantii]